MPDPSEYRVGWLQNAVTAIRDFLQASPPIERRQALAALLRGFDERLRREPLEVGEIYRSRGNVVEHHAAKDFLAIEFAVDTARKLVVVRKCRFLSGPNP
jgi:hypothetical protein